jgi:2,5-diketo-D-gluconate reductase A
MVIMTNATLSTGASMPLVGFGTWQLTGRAAYEATRQALDAGYRHIDTATMYRNEREIGRAVQDSDVPREQIFITTKVPADNAGRERETLEASLRGLGTEYVDLWLIHWPPRDEVPAVNQIPWSPWEHDQARLDEHTKRGIVLEGYSPFKRSDLRSPVLTTIAKAHDVTPAQAVLRWHVEHGIVVIPKSATPDRIVANLDVFGFTLSPDEVAALDALTV